MDAERPLQGPEPRERIGAETGHYGAETPTAVGGVALEGVSQELTQEAAPNAQETKESVAKQLDTAHKGYQAVVNSLNTDRLKDKIEVASSETLSAEFEAWMTENKLAYINAAREADPELRFTLVATPNVLASATDIAKAVKDFGNGQPSKPNINDVFYELYTPQQLSGTNPDNGNAVVFSLLPSKMSQDIGGTVAEQRAAFKALQVETEVKVPSVLESVTYWQTLRAQGVTLTGSGVVDLTYIRHFNLPEQRLVVWSFVPYSYLRAYGWPELNGSRMDQPKYGRISVA